MLFRAQLCLNINHERCQHHLTFRQKSCASQKIILARLLYDKQWWFAITSFDDLFHCLCPWI